MPKKIARPSFQSTRVVVRVRDSKRTLNRGYTCKLANHVPFIQTVARAVRARRTRGARRRAQDAGEPGLGADGGAPDGRCVWRGCVLGRCRVYSAREAAAGAKLRVRAAARGAHGKGRATLGQCGIGAQRRGLPFVCVLCHIHDALRRAWPDECTGTMNVAKAPFGPSFCTILRPLPPLPRM